MNRWLALVGISLIFGAAITPFRGAPGTSAQEVRAIEFVVNTPDGTPVELHFTVRAPNDASAYAAARAATESLLPGALAERDGSVSGAYAFWPWQWPLELMPVPVLYNADGAPEGLAADAIRNGVMGWNDVDGSAFQIRYHGTTDATPGLHLSIADGQNTIGWADMECTVGCVLGVTTKLPDRYEADIVLNSNPAAKLGDGRNQTADLETVVLHEVGHLAGLEHSCQPYTTGCTTAESQSVMFPRYQGTHRGLAPDDIAGIAALYPLEEGVLEPGEPQPQVDYQLELERGWNLVVLPPGTLDGTFASLPSVDAVYHFEEGGWRVWVRDLTPALNSLTAAAGDRAYWVHSDADCAQTFTVPSPTDSGDPASSA